MTCQCTCGGSWTGPKCDQCRERKCAHGGIFNKKTCECDCLPPWFARDDCLTCPLSAAECQNGGTVDLERCMCQCKGVWRGEKCDVCPSYEDLIVQAGFDCGTYGFNPLTCSCRNACAINVVCEHGSMPQGSGSDCRCDCSALNNDKNDDVSLNTTFWTGRTCGECANDDGRTKCEAQSLAFDAASCSCTAQQQVRETKDESAATTGAASRNECILSADDCENGAAFSGSLCACACSEEWYGPTCSISADDAHDNLGDDEEFAATSCLEIMSARPDVSDGMYWIASSAKGEKATFLYCDMTENGGGWALIADIGADLSTALMTNETYLYGLPSDEWRDRIGSDDDDERSNFVAPCALMDSGSDAVEMRVSMGSVRDYFRPLPGESLCSMLTHHDRHLWSASDGSPDAVKAFHDFVCAKTDGAEEGSGDCSILPWNGADRSVVFEAEKKESDDRSSASESDTAASSLLELRSKLRRIERAGDRRRALRHRRRRLLSDEDSDAHSEAVSTQAKDAENFRWFQPEYIDDPKLEGLLGGAKKGWGVDGREYLSFWGGDKGGCCHAVSQLYPSEEGLTEDGGAWGQTFQLHIRPAK